jgi:hypothetical protein
MPLSHLQSSIALLNKAAEALLPPGWKEGPPPPLARLARWGVANGLASNRVEDLLTSSDRMDPDKQAEWIATSGVDEGVAFGPDELTNAGLEGAAEIVLEAISYN